MSKAENLAYNSYSKIKGKKGYEKDNMTKHKLGPSKEMSAVQKKKKEKKQANQNNKELQ